MPELKVLVLENACPSALDPSLDDANLLPIALVHLEKLTIGSAIEQLEAFFSNVFLPKGIQSLTVNLVCDAPPKFQRMVSAMVRANAFLAADGTEICLEVMDILYNSELRFQVSQFFEDKQNEVVSTPFITWNFIVPKSDLPYYEDRHLLKDAYSRSFVALHSCGTWTNLQELDISNLHSR
ncbi:hypothetical protein D9619_003518 [Psilocybe cf. subviscida]|uniref:Uncharacterized protein n=1 Tax=Psilocybe cf. subviscida TaxID=2480587 RepID=A0A8H5AYR9_9AGAR|nr:hypothetical protein D9619_003518 [Psilocybe cf. subviscida]